MADGLENEVQAGLAEAFKNAVVDTTGIEFQNVMNPGAIPEAKIETPAETKIEPPADSSLKLDDLAKVVPPTETKIDATPVKSFEDLITEQSGGKFKSWKEVDDLINTPKEELDPDIQHLNELKKSGVKFDREFWEVQTKDYKSMDRFEILLEAMKLKEENKGLPDDVLFFKMKEKYQYDKWSEDGTEPTETELMQDKIVDRDADLDRQFLIARQQKLTTVKKQDPNVIAQQTEQAIKAQELLEKQIDEIVPKFSKLSTPITIGADGKVIESFDYDVSEEARKNAATTLKLMTKDVSVFWNRFKGEDGNISNEKVYEMLLKLEHDENRIKIAHQNALAKGREMEIKEIKKIDFSKDGTPAKIAGNSLQEAMKASASKHF